MFGSIEEIFIEPLSIVSQRSGLYFKIHKWSVLCINRAIKGKILNVFYALGSKHNLTNIFLPRSVSLYCSFGIFDISSNTICNHITLISQY